jgi:HEAT repeat protein
MLRVVRRAEAIYAVSLVTLLLAAVVPGVPQASSGKAWMVLQAGLSNSNTDNRTVATRLLGGLTKNAQAQDLALKVLSDNRPEVRAAAAEALGNMQAKSAIPQLQKLVQSEQDAGVAIAAGRALVALGDPLGYAVYYAILTGERKSGASLMENQRKMLNDPKKLANFGFEQGVGFIPFGGLTLNVFRSLTRDDVSPIRAAAAEVLITDPDPRTTEALKTAVADRSWVVRAAAIDALGKRNNPSVIPALEPALDDGREAVRYAAAAAIIRLNDVKNGKSPAKPANKRATKPK